MRSGPPQLLYLFSREIIRYCSGRRIFIWGWDFHRVFGQIALGFDNFPSVNFLLFSWVFRRHFFFFFFFFFCRFDSYLFYYALFTFSLKIFPPLWQLFLVSFWWEFFQFHEDLNFFFFLFHLLSSLNSFLNTVFLVIYY